MYLETEKEEARYQTVPKNSINNKNYINIWIYDYKNMDWKIRGSGRPPYV